MGQNTLGECINSAFRKAIFWPKMYNLTNWENISWWCKQSLVADGWKINIAVTARRPQRDKASFSEATFMLAADACWHTDSLWTSHSSNKRCIFSERLLLQIMCLRDTERWRGLKGWRVAVRSLLAYSHCCWQTRGLQWYAGTRAFYWCIHCEQRQ